MRVTSDMATQSLPKKILDELDTAHSHLRAIMDRDFMMRADDIEDLVAAVEIIAQVLGDHVA